jgi:Spy/CpxP family protein refolding chaperone
MYAFKLLCILVMLLAGPVMGQPLFPESPPPVEHPILERRPSLDLQGLNLTEDQRKQIQAFQKEDRQKLQGLRTELEKVQQEVRGMFATASDEDIVQRFEQIEQRQIAIARIRLNNLLKIRAVLTPTQRQQLKDRVGILRPSIRSF